jgi:hypothetical protein
MKYIFKNIKKFIPCPMQFAYCKLPVANFLLLLAFCLLPIAYCSAHGGEDHGEKKKETSQPGKTYFTINSVSDVFEMTLRYEPLLAGHTSKMKLFVSDFSTNKAIDSASIEITSPEDDKLKFVVQQIDKGTYTIEGTFPENKSYSLIANISVADNADLMTLEGIEVGKDISLPGEEHTESSFFSWQMLLTFLAGIILSASFIFGLKKVKNYNNR